MLTEHQTNLASKLYHIIDTGETCYFRCKVCGLVTKSKPKGIGSNDLNELLTHFRWYHPYFYHLIVKPLPVNYDCN